MLKKINCKIAKLQHCFFFDFIYIIKHLLIQNNNLNGSSNND